MRKLLTLAVFTATLATGYSFASGPRSVADVPRDQWLSQEQVKAEFTTRGYAVRRVKAEGRHYEVYATDPDGQRIEAYVHPVTGEVLRQREHR